MSSSTISGESRAVTSGRDSRGGRPSNVRARLITVAQRLGALVVVLALWTWFARTKGADANFPTPPQALDKLGELMRTSAYWHAVSETLLTALIGFVIAAAIGIPLGMLIGMSRRAQLSTQFLVDFGRTIPVIALLPLAILVLHIGRTMAVFLIVFGAVWPLLVQATYAVAQITPQSRQVVRAFRISTIERIRFVYAPSMLPFLMTGLRIAASISLLIAVTAEYLGRVPGLGVEMRDSGETDPRATFVYMLTTGALGLMLNVGLVVLQKRVLWWHPSQRGKVD
ncbi:ABC transporter permease [Nocardioides nematodiphilus]|uniref:ABC transporter permease n=1 Tax=Nocardioides nematodiphilus TaxID=2849669 RepID=UPI001CDA0ECA|nr:ABC transporter permease [Nocardioides nematodiphilus]MCA1983238.1 ABC transporter permease [Nocardioides nematodiphilus]